MQLFRYKFLHYREKTRSVSGNNYGQACSNLSQLPPLLMYVGKWPAAPLAGKRLARVEPEVDLGDCTLQKSEKKRVRSLLKLGLKMATTCSGLHWLFFGLTTRGQPLHFSHFTSYRSDTVNSKSFISNIPIIRKFLIVTQLDTRNIEVITQKHKIQLTVGFMRSSTRSSKWHHLFVDRSIWICFLKYLSWRKIILK